MKKILLLLAVFSLVGCNGIRRLVDGPQSPASDPQPQLLNGSPVLPASAPDFGIPVPAGYRRVVFYDALPASGVIPVQANAGASVDVFIDQKAIGQWFKLKPTYSGAFWYEADTADGSVTVHGDHLEQIQFCVYEYIPVVPS